MTDTITQGRYEEALTEQIAREAGNFWYTQRGDIGAIADPETLLSFILAEIGKMHRECSHNPDLRNGYRYMCLNNIINAVEVEVAYMLEQKAKESLDRAKVNE